MSHDDICLPDFLRRCVETISAANPSVVLVYPRCNLIDGVGAFIEEAPDGLETRSHEAYRRLGVVLRRVGYAYALWGLIRSESLRNTRLMGHVLADYVMLAELALQGEFREIPEVHFQLRVHAGNAWAINSADQAP